ncbi:heat-inducible transcriptional repressor HrcA [Candidatus Acetothermia bacterium]|jgi:heat-inducible transcriptional repressor|nr:heat-inducible transcriptional repressor HrcA [Candidatus Acetothermia bacterium]MCI2427250.1 heat-inducible transcriptional repressor HrcA [Candidatus Acetothermia bacterium]MCI2428762.1 heat-inducible transcriptional repressor HrcA [Candidatus Acetothermia bacterium]
MKERQNLILKVIVDRYVKKQEPVSSRTLLQEYNLPISSATVRNDMNELEEKGYIEKAYPSAGRTPTPKGYRFFVNWLLELSNMIRQESFQIIESYPMKCFDIDDLLQHTALLLANITDVVGFVIPPQLEEAKFDYVTITSRRPRAVLVVIVTDLGIIKSGIAQLEEYLSIDEINEVTAAINYNFHGMKLEDLRTLAESKDRDGWYNKAVSSILILFGNLLKRKLYRRIYCEGIYNIVKKSERSAPEESLRNLAGLIESIDDAESFSKAIAEVRQGQTGIVASIGDYPLANFRDYAIITADYGRYAGVLGTIGPLWMDYAKAISAISYFAQRLKGAFTAT